MICSKADLKRYLAEDKRALDMHKRHPSFWADEIWKYEIALRHQEYWTNQPRRPARQIALLFWRYRRHRLSVQLGIQIPPNTCGAGLRINHYGLIVISPYARIGTGLNIHQGVNIGVNIEPGKAPRIGNNVFIGPGAKLFGDISIADDTAIAAGAVVNHSFLRAGTTIGGVPATVIRDSRGNPFRVGMTDQPTEIHS